MSLRGSEIMWLLGAGASVAAGVPSADGLMWRLRCVLMATRRRLPIDQLNPADPLVRDAVTRWLEDTADLPSVGDPDEYALLFDAAWSTVADRRRWLEPFLEQAEPSFGHLVLAALSAAGRVRLVWSTNFDRCVEDAHARLAGRTGALTVATCESPASASVALDALREERFPLFVKLHGDYQSQRLKNTVGELADQDARLRQCLERAGQSRGLVVCGYSGRDASVMDAVEAVLNGPTPYPAGLYWCVRPGESPSPRVASLLHQAADRSVTAGLLEVPTFDELLGMVGDVLGIPQEFGAILDAARPARRTPFARSRGPRPGWPALRCNALPVLALPRNCRLWAISDPYGGREVREKAASAGEPPPLVALRRREGLAGFGPDEAFRKVFDGWALGEPDIAPLRSLRHSAEHGLILDALSLALARGKPLRRERLRREWWLVIDSSHEEPPDGPPSDHEPGYAALRSAITRPLTGVLTSGAGVHFAEPVWFAEAVRLRLEVLDDQPWLVFEPRVWLSRLPDDADGQQREARAIWRRERTERRWNRAAAAILAAWAQLLGGTGPNGPDRASISAFGLTGSEDDPGVDATFEFGLITGYTRGGPVSKQARVSS
jgi:NAD-dependent SIR2 family protein deacetylase